MTLWLQAITAGLVWLLAATGNVWALAALYFDMKPGWLACVFILLCLTALGALLWKVRGLFLKPVSCLLPFVLVMVWWASLKPSQHRDWSPEYARLSWAEINGDAITLHDFRNVQYRSARDFTPRWETRNVRLSRLQGVDLFLSYWGSRHIAHPVVSFDFGEDERVCFSVETRREKPETFSAIRGFFRQFELYYVMGDERDLVGGRVVHRLHEQAYRFPLQIPPEALRLIFLDYLRGMNDLRDKPQWYNAATMNCTTAIRVHARAGELLHAWDWRILLNGHFDERLYEYQVISNELPFAEMKKQAKLPDSVRSLSSDDPDFSRLIRQRNP